MGSNFPSVFYNPVQNQLLPNSKVTTAKTLAISETPKHTLRPDIKLQDHKKTTLPQHLILHSQSNHPPYPLATSPSPPALAPLRNRKPKPGHPVKYRCGINQPPLKPKNTAPRATYIIYIYISLEQARRRMVVVYTSGQGRRKKSGRGRERRHSRPGVLRPTAHCWAKARAAGARQPTTTRSSEPILIGRLLLLLQLGSSLQR